MFLTIIINIIFIIVNAELRFNFISEDSSRFPNYSSWQRCFASQYSQWYDVFSGGHVQASIWSCWWASKGFKCTVH